jgi:hypothetical protein
MKLFTLSDSVKDSFHRGDAETQREKEPLFNSLYLLVSAPNKLVIFLVGYALITMFIPGCSSPGVLVIHQAPDAKMQMSKVAASGDYGLFRAGEQQPLLEFSLKAGDPIGFERQNDGIVIWLYAVAGNVRNRLEVDKAYEWRRL